MKANCKRDKSVDVSILYLLPARIAVPRMLLLLSTKLVPPSLSAVPFLLTLNGSRKDQHAILHVKHLLVEAIFHQELVVVPHSIILPRSSTRISSIRSIATRRWVITSAVRPLHQRIEGIQHRLLCQWIKVIVRARAPRACLSC